MCGRIAHGVRLHGKCLRPALADTARVAQPLGINFQPRSREGAAVVVKLIGCNQQFLAGVDYATVAQCACVLQSNNILAGDGAAVVQAPGMGVDVNIIGCCGADGAGIGQHAIGVDAYLPCASASRGCDAACIAHAYACFGADEGDLARVHAAQGAYVQRKARRVVAGGGMGLHVGQAARTG